MADRLIKLLVFDWDGTLADSTASIVNAMHAAISEIGMESRSDNNIKDIIGLGLMEAVAVLYPDINHADRENLAHKYRMHYTQAYHGKTVLFPGVLMRQSPSLIHKCCLI